MDSDIGAIEKELDSLDASFSRYFSLVNERFQIVWNQQYDKKSLASAQELTTQGLGQEREQLHKRLDDICLYYLATTNETRRSLREFVSDRRPLLLALRDHPGWCARWINGPGDRALLRNGAAAVSLQDNRLDFRDNYLALGNLYLTAVRAGIQPTLDFYKIGLLSSSASRNKKWPQDTTQNFLSGFEESAYFKESVAPKLS